MTEWYYYPLYSQELELAGSLEDLIEFLREGLIADDAYIWTKGMPSITHADLVPEILDRLPLMDPEKIAAACAAAADLDPGSEEHQWALDKLHRLVRFLPERAWPIIVRMVELAPSEAAVDVIAAGPLEDLLCFHGEAFIERIEKEAKEDPHFRFALGGVWQRTISEPVWRRVNRLTGGPR
ncbi:MAG TPA: hypothetical protein VJ725_27885 [Thermoanaerobaculia bacterium]|nr:hypothetical protein [Thermoanaerobaculia bacterium]